MIKLDENLLVELGLAALPKDEKTSFLKHMYETLEMRVGTRLAERMSDQQMSEFEQFINSNDEQGAFHWLESNFPNYKEVVAEEFEKLKGEIKPMAADIMAASQAQQAQLAQNPQQQMPPQAPPAGYAPDQQQQYQQAPPQDQQSAGYPQQPAAPTQQQPVYDPQSHQTQPLQQQPQQQPMPGHHPQYPQQ